jgi:hypothetical protein
MNDEASIDRAACMQKNEMGVWLIIFSVFCLSIPSLGSPLRTARARSLSAAAPAGAEKNRCSRVSPDPPSNTGALQISRRVTSCKRKHRLYAGKKMTWK